MSERPKSPVNGQPVPEGKPPFKPGEEAREIGRKGGKKSGEVRRARKTLREDLIELLKNNITDKNGKSMQAQVAMSSALLKQALSGNTKAYEIIRDTIGEKPTETVSIVSADYKALDDAFNGLMSVTGGDSA